MLVQSSLIGTSRDRNEDVPSQLSQKLQDTLAGSKSGSVSVTSCCVVRPHDVDRMLESSVSCAESVDFVILVSTLPFGAHTSWVNRLKPRLTKLADSMALQVRRGAAQEVAASAMYETVIGYLTDRKSLVICLHRNGMEAGLSNVRGLIKHAVRLARGGDQAHHHG